MPLFKLLKKTNQFKWSPKAERELQGLKEYLSSPLVLTAPIPSELLLLYVAATPGVISAILVAKRNHVDSQATGPSLLA